jgi:hypothetical protein
MARAHHAEVAEGLVILRVVGRRDQRFDGRNERPLCGRGQQLW